MRRGHEEVLDVVLVLQLHAHDADSAAPLLPVRRDGEPLDVAGAGDRDHHVLLRDQVLQLELAFGGDDLRAPVVVPGIDRLDLEYLLADQAVHARLVSQDRAKLGDPLLEVGELLVDPLPFESGETLEAEVENRLRLDFAQIELSLKAFPGLVRVG